MIYTLEEAMKQAATRFGTEGHDVSGSFITDGAVVFEGGAWKPNPDAGAGQEPGQTWLVVDGRKFDETWCAEQVGNLIAWTMKMDDREEKARTMTKSVDALVVAVRKALVAESHG